MQELAQLEEHEEKKLKAQLLQAQAKAVMNLVQFA